MTNPAEFTELYGVRLRDYRMSGEKIGQARCGNRVIIPLRRAVQQERMLRGSRDFVSATTLAVFEILVEKAGRMQRLGGRDGVFINELAERRLLSYKGERVQADAAVWSNADRKRQLKGSGTRTSPAGTRKGQLAVATFQEHSGGLRAAARAPGLILSDKQIARGDPLSQ